MNCGLGNLDSLKQHLLPANTMLGQTQFDQVLTDIGQTVAGEFENHCGRLFERTVSDLVVFQADRASFVLPRYPIESIILVELKLTDADGFVGQDATFIQSSSPMSGLVYLPEPPDAGPYWAEVRFTYTGGYWWEEMEPDDQGYPSAQPAGSFALPKALRGAWLNHCRAVWNAYDKLGVGLIDKPNMQTVINDLDFSKSVERTLENYRLMQLI